MNRLLRRRKGSQRNMKRIFMGVTALLIASLLLLSVARRGMLLGLFPNGQATRAISASTASPTMIAVFGTDSPDKTGTGEIDSCVLIKFDKSKHHLDVLSIPAGTILKYPDGHKGPLKSALLFGGPRLAVQLIHRLTNEPVSSYVVLHYRGLIDFINAIDGVTVTVQKPVDYDTGGTGPYSHIHLKTGSQTLNGFEALEFVRFRDKQSANLGRVHRQQLFVEAVLTKLEKPKNVAVLPSAVKAGWGSVDSNLGLPQVTELALNAKNFTSWQLSEALLPGKATSASVDLTSRKDTGQSSDWKVNRVMEQKVISNLFNKGQGQAVKQNAGPQTTHPKKTAAKQGNASAPASETSTGTSGSSTTPVRHHIMIATASVNIRSGPGTSYKIIGSATMGHQVTVIGKAGKWYQIIVRGKETGYIADWLVKSPSGTSAASNTT